MMSDSHADRADRVMQAMLKMKKIDIQRLKDAYEDR
jgi:predicted 3-demethylubiquinone-9 3-methyltransferase (glyoxalase superfamily)